VFRFEKGPDKFPGLFHCSWAIAGHVYVVMHELRRLFIHIGEEAAKKRRIGVNVYRDKKLIDSFVTDMKVWKRTTSQK
jgi:hypothetical protein